MLAVTWYGAGRLGFDRADRIAIQFAGSKKSLAAGLPMASVLFGPQASLAVLPLMLFHQMQLMVCAVIAKRRAHDGRPTAPEPRAGPPRGEGGVGRITPRAALDDHRGRYGAPMPALDPGRTALVLVDLMERIVALPLPPPRH